MATRVVEEYTQVLSQIWNEIWLEIDKAGENFDEELTKFWEDKLTFSNFFSAITHTGWSGFQEALEPGSFYRSLADDLLNIVGNYVQNLSRVPAKVITRELIANMPVPKSASWKVMTVADAYRFTVQQMVDAAFDMSQGNLPPTFTISGRVLTKLDTWKLLTKLDFSAGLRVLKSGIKSRVAALLSAAMAIATSLVVVGMVVWFIRKINQASEQPLLADLALPQDSKIVWKKQPKFKLQRVNARKGPDIL